MKRLLIGAVCIASLQTLPALAQRETGSGMASGRRQHEPARAPQPDAAKGQQTATVAPGRGQDGGAPTGNSYSWGVSVPPPSVVNPPGMATPPNVASPSGPSNPGAIQK